MGTHRQGHRGAQCRSPVSRTCHVHSITPRGVRRRRRGRHGAAVLGSQVPGWVSPFWYPQYSFLVPLVEEQALVGTELVSAVYGSLTTHEPHSPPLLPHRKHSSCRSSFLRAASKHLRRLLTMTEEPHRLLALAAGTVSSMPC